MKRTQMSLRNATAFLLGGLVVAAAGCSPAKSKHPTSELTTEQIEALRAEDAQVAMEESQGSILKTKKPAKC